MGTVLNCLYSLPYSALSLLLFSSYFSLMYLTAKLPDPAKLPLHKIPLEPHYNHNPKINSKAMILEVCNDVL
jgi:hypothetical protein